MTVSGNTQSTRCTQSVCAAGPFAAFSEDGAATLSWTFSYASTKDQRPSNATYKVAYASGSSCDHREWIVRNCFIIMGAAHAGDHQRANTSPGSRSLLTVPVRGQVGCCTLQLCNSTVEVELRGQVPSLGQ